MSEERVVWTVPFVHDRTGERRVVTVALTRFEYLDAMCTLALRGPDGVGGPSGMVAKGYALRRACKAVSRDFSAVVEGMKRIEGPRAVI